MAGQIKQMIDKIVEFRSKGNPILIRTTRAKLMLKGINPDSYNEFSDDDSKILEQLKSIARDLGVDINIF